MRGENHAVAVVGRDREGYKEMPDRALLTGRGKTTFAMPCPASPHRHDAATTMPPPARIYVVARLPAGEYVELPFSQRVKCACLVGCFNAAFSRPRKYDMRRVTGIAGASSAELRPVPREP